MNQILIENKFASGAFRDKFDSRDKKYLAMASLPMDWQKGYDIETELSIILKAPAFKLSAKDQNGSSSCGGQAFSTYAQVLEAVFTKTFEERSAKYIYAQTFVPGGGSYGRDCCKVLKSQGVARETFLTSYENGNAPSEKFMERSQDIGIDARNDAKNSKILTYKNVNPDIESVAQAIRDNRGVVLGITGENNGTWLSAFPKPPQSNPNTEWRHWIYAGKAKLINGKKHIGVLNSWGKNCGENGWQWVGEDYFKTKVSDGLAVWNSWTITFDESPTLPTFEEKKTDVYWSLASLWTLLAELIQRTSVGKWLAGFTANERAKTAGSARSSDWPRVRREHLKNNPRCALCLGTKTIEVHHIRPFHLHPELELEPSNLITLCESGANGIVCHRAIGHLGNYQAINPESPQDALLWRSKIQNRQKSV
jgi:hypothetical protein